MLIQALGRWSFMCCSTCRPRSLRSCSARWRSSCAGRSPSGCGSPTTGASRTSSCCATSPASAPRSPALENLPEGGCIIASKHQSDWDIFAILPHSQTSGLHRQEAADGHSLLRLGGADLRNHLDRSLARRQGHSANGRGRARRRRTRLPHHHLSRGHPAAAARRAGLQGRRVAHLRRRSTYRLCRWRSIPACSGAGVSRCSGRVGRGPIFCRQSRPACLPKRCRSALSRRSRPNPTGWSCRPGARESPGRSAPRCRNG